MTRASIGTAAVIIIIALIALVAVSSGVGVWNTLNREYQAVEGSKSQYSAALNTCTEKIKGVWEITNQYMDHESETFKAVAQARSGYDTAREAFEKAAAEGKGTEELTKAGTEVVSAAMAFRIQVEAYPQLRAVEASERHGMPVRSEGFKLFSREHPSTYPQNIAYKAAQMQGQVLADKLLRRIREASAAEARQTNTTEVLLELASEVGLDIARFLDDFTHGPGQQAFEQDLAITAKYGARGFPSFLLKYGEKEIVIRGYKRYEEFKALIVHLSGGAIQERPVPANEETIMAFITRYGSVAPVEIQMTFDLTNDGLKTVIDSLLHKQLVRRREAGNGYFISPKVSAAACDPATGVCSI